MTMGRGKAPKLDVRLSREHLPLCVGDVAAVVEEALADGAEVVCREIGNLLQTQQFIIRQS